jgi:hypothetical protein
LSEVRQGTYVLKKSVVKIGLEVRIVEGSDYVYIEKYFNDYYFIIKKI